MIVDYVIKQECFIASDCCVVYKDDKDKVKVYYVPNKELAIGINYNFVGLIKDDAKYFNVTGNPCQWCIYSWDLGVESKGSVDKANGDDVFSVFERLCKIEELKNIISQFKKRDLKLFMMLEKIRVQKRNEDMMLEKIKAQAQKRNERNILPN